MNRTFLKEGAARVVFALAAALSILAVGLICVFLFANGVPAMVEIGIPDFLLGTTWRPANDIYGIFPMIIGSIYVTAGALIFGVPAGLLTAIFLSRFASAKVAALLKPGVELLAGIPSVVYGFFGLMIIVPFIRLNAPGNGLSLLAASIFDGVRTMTANIVLEMGYAADLHRGALIATGVVLFVFILLISMLFNAMKKRGERS